MLLIPAPAARLWSRTASSREASIGRRRTVLVASTSTSSGPCCALRSAPWPKSAELAAALCLTEDPTCDAHKNHQQYHATAARGDALGDHLEVLLELGLNDLPYSDAGQRAGYACYEAVALHLEAGQVHEAAA